MSNKLYDNWQESLEEADKCMCGKLVGGSCPVHRTYTAKQYNDLTAALATANGTLANTQSALAICQKDYGLVTADLARVKGELEEWKDRCEASRPGMKCSDCDASQMTDTLQARVKLLEAALEGWVIHAQVDKVLRAHTKLMDNSLLALADGGER